MAIIGFNSKDLTGNTSEEVSVPKDSMRTTSILDTDTPIYNYVEFLEGKDLRVVYFNRLITEDELNTELDIYSPVSTSSYNQIDNMIIKTTTDIEVDGNDELSGSGLVFGITPLVNDYIHINLLYGRTGLFKVTSVKEKSYMHDPVFEIEYVLDSYTETDSTRIDALIEKSATKLVYKTNGSITTVENFNKEFSLKDKYREMSEYYINLFFRNKSDIHAIEVNGLIIDVSFSKFVRSTIETDSNVYLFSNRLKTGYNRGNMFASLNKQNKSLFMLSDTKHVITSNVGNYRAYDVAMSIESVREEVESSDILCSNVIEERTEDDEITLLPVLKKYEYVFTNEFYTTLRPYSKLEELVRKFLEFEPIPTSDLDEFVTGFHSFTLLEKYYYIPIILLIIKYTLERNTYVRYY